MDACIVYCYRKFRPLSKPRCGESSQAEVCRRHNLSEDQVSKWKQQFLENAVSVFTAKDQQSSKDAERIAHLERLVGRMAVAMDIQKKALTFLEGVHVTSAT